MGSLIKIHDIEEFSRIKAIPDASVNDDILTSIRNLDEKNELECFVREILYDPNTTPHGTTEIADILTSHCHIKGKKFLAAFVLKGKSYNKVSSKSVTHQFMKLRQVAEIGLMVFGAVGDIQDDAQRDFIQVARDYGCDYLIIDAQDWARLLIAYEKACPKDGSPYDQTGTCIKGHTLDAGLPLEMEVREKHNYSITVQKDISHGGAKRYSAIIVTDRHYPKDILRSIIEDATNKLRGSNYYRNEQVKERWGKFPAQVVWLYIAYGQNDIKNANWVCRTCFIDQSLAESMRPIGLKGDEKVGEIDVEWNPNYKTTKDFLESHSETKEKFLERLSPLLKEMINLAECGIKIFGAYKSENISEDELVNRLQKIEPRVSQLYNLSCNIPIPPDDCNDYYQAAQNLFATIHNLFLYYSQNGLQTWPKLNREWLMQNTIKRFPEDIQRIKFEESKIH